MNNDESESNKIKEIAHDRETSEDTSGDDEKWNEDRNLEDILREEVEEEDIVMSHNDDDRLESNSDELEGNEEIFMLCKIIESLKTRMHWA